jgi:glycosyltransferase involved in cell wall biosynthesis
MDNQNINYDKVMINGIDPKESIQYLYNSNKERIFPDIVISEHLQHSVEIIYSYTNEFDYKKYFSMYPDLNAAGITSELEAYKHWIECGKLEGRCAGIIDSQEAYNDFEWESYLQLNKDLHDIGVITCLDAYMHWCTVGRNDNRQVTRITSIKIPTNTTIKLKIAETVHIFTNDEDNKMWVKILMDDLQYNLKYIYYMATYPDLEKGSILSYYDAFIHWVMHGKLEGRYGSPPSTKTTVEIEQLLPDSKTLPMYIIILSTRIDKKMDMTYQLNKIGYTNYEFFKAYDKNSSVVKEKYSYYEKAFDEGTIRTSPVFYKSKAKRKVIGSIGAVGLIQSTIELFKYIEKQKQNHVIICEDDAQFHKSFKYLLKPVRLLMHETDMVYLGYNSHIPSINNIIVNDESKIIEKIPKHEGLNTLYGTYGYICSSKFRKKIIELGIDWFIQNNCTIDYGYNVLYRDGVVTGAVPTGEHLIIPDIFDDDAINGHRANKESFYTDRCIEYANYHSQIENKLKFVFIVPSYNNEKWIDRNLNSMFNQTYTNWRMIYVNDNSTDNTKSLFQQLSAPHQNKITYLDIGKKYGQAFNRYRCYNMCDDDEICIMLDGDDWLPHNYVLAYLNKFMVYYKLDVTYGRFEVSLNDKLTPFNMPGDYSMSVIESGKYRSDAWRATHLRVMKAEYLKRIRPTDFLDEEGDFIICTTDMVESFACLEQCNGKHKMCSEITMVYNKDNSLLFKETSHYSDVNKDKKIHTQAYVRSLPSYKNEKKKKKVVVVDVNDPLFKTHINSYRKTFQKECDLFIYASDELPYYMKKLNTYDDIMYI